MERRGLNLQLHSKIKITWELSKDKQSKIKETQSCLLEKIHKIYKCLTTLTEKREKTEINKIRN